MTAGTSAWASCTPWSPARSLLLLRHPRSGREPEPGRPFEQARSPVWLRTHASRARLIKNTFSNIWFNWCWRGNRELSLRTGRLTMGTDDPWRLWTGRRRRWRSFALVAVQVAPRFRRRRCFLFSSFFLVFLLWPKREKCEEFEKVFEERMEENGRESRKKIYERESKRRSR